MTDPTSRRQERRRVNQPTARLPAILLLDPSKISQVPAVRSTVREVVPVTPAVVIANGLWDPSRSARLRVAAETFRVIV
jgi:hypothetical protein